MYVLNLSLISIEKRREDARWLFDPCKSEGTGQE